MDQDAGRRPGRPAGKSRRLVTGGHRDRVRARGADAAYPLRQDGPARPDRGRVDPDDPAGGHGDPARRDPLQAGRVPGLILPARPAGSRTGVSSPSMPLLETVAHFEKPSPGSSGPSPTTRNVMWPASFQLTRPTSTGPFSWTRVRMPSPYVDVPVNCCVLPFWETCQVKLPDGWIVSVI